MNMKKTVIKPVLSVAAFFGGLIIVGLFDADTKKVLPGPIVFKGNGNLNDME